MSLRHVLTHREASFSSTSSRIRGFESNIRTFWILFPHIQISVISVCTGSILPTRMQALGNQAANQDAAFSSRSVLFWFDWSGGRVQQQQSPQTVHQIREGHVCVSGAPCELEITVTSAKHNGVPERADLFENVTGRLEKDQRVGGPTSDGFCPVPLLGCAECWDQHVELPARKTQKRLSIFSSGGTCDSCQRTRHRHKYTATCKNPPLCHTPQTQKDLNKHSRGKTGSDRHTTSGGDAATHCN